MTILMNTCKQYPENPDVYEVTTTGKGLTISRTKRIGTAYTEKGLQSKIHIIENEKKDVVTIFVGAKKIEVDYSEIQELMVAIKVYNRDKQQEYDLFELKEY